MAHHLEDSFQSALDYEAEVAYISLTSPLRSNAASFDNEEEEFDFEQVDTPQALQEQPQAQHFLFPTSTPEQSYPQSEEVMPAVPPSPSPQQAVSNTPTQEPGKPPLLNRSRSPRPPLIEIQEEGKHSPTELAGQDGTGCKEQIDPLRHEELTGKSSQTGHVEPAGQTTPTTVVSSRETLSSSEKKKEKRSASLSPLTISVAHYTLDTELPSTPRSKLRRIKDAQAPPSPKARPKMQQEEHQYCTLVIYGSSGCGRTQLVDKLALSNPSVFTKVIPSTTRRKRPNEVSGVDFHYLSHQEMNASLSRGEFIESIRVHKKGKEAELLRRKAVTKQASLFNMPSPPKLKNFRSASLEVSAIPSTLSSTLPSPSPSTPPSTPPTSRDTEGKYYGSLFDLTEDDNPTLGGEVFGTTHQSLSAAIHQGKPCILLNVSARGAQQLKEAALQASYIMIQNDHTTSKTRQGVRIAEGNHGSLKSQTVAPDHTISATSLDKAYADLHDYAFQLLGKLQVNSASQYQVAQYEWEAMPTVQFEQIQPLPNQKAVNTTFSEILAHFHSANLKQQQERAKVERSRASLLLFGRLSKKLHSERLMVQALAYCQINEKERIHLRILQTVYCKLTGNVLSCRRLGPHWQEIGFTGVDPADDLHRVGLLGVIQLVYFLENPSTACFCKEIFHYCHKDTHVIPFVVMAFEFSQLCLEVLDGGGLNKVCNKRDQVFVVINEFYMAAFHYYYQNWKSSQKSILQLGLLMQQCGDYCKTHPRQVMLEFDKYLSIKEPQNQLIPPKVEGAFTLFEDIKSQT